MVEDIIVITDSDKECACGGLKVVDYSVNHDRYMLKCVGRCRQWSEPSKPIVRPHPQLTPGKNPVPKKGISGF